MQISQDELNQFFDYDAESGNLIWKVHTNSHMKIGEVAGWEDPKEYRQISLLGKRYKAHRLIWIYHYGELNGILDHIDGDKHNNRIENLRLATPSQNNCNTGLIKSNKSGLKGLYWDKINEKWRVQIEINRVRKNVGRFADLFEAACVIISLRNKLHGEFANSGTKASLV